MVGILYGFAYSKKALRSLQSLEVRERRQIVKKIKDLASNPHPPGSRQVIGERDGDEPVYRVRSGDYRILYVVRQPTISVIDIGHRKDIYRGT